MVLLNIGIEQPGFANDFFEAGKYAVFLDLMMIDEPLRPNLGQEEQIFNVFGFLHIGRLQVDAIDATQNGIVTKGHVVGDGDGFVSFLFLLVTSLTHGATYDVLGFGGCLHKLQRAVRPEFARHFRG